MGTEAQILIAELHKLRQEQRSAKRTNAMAPRLIPRSLGLIQARAAWDIEYARRLVFDHFKWSGAGPTRTSNKTTTLQAVHTCLSLFQDELDDQDDPTPADWKLLEEIAGL